MALALVASFNAQAEGGAQADTVAAAAKAKDFVAVEARIKDGLDVNEALADGSTALDWAIYWNQPKLVKSLLRKGADPSHPTRLGATPLYMAASQGSADLVEMLLDAGADPNARVLSNGETPLMFAARSGNVDAVEHLLDAGAEIDAKDTYRETTALMWAAEQNHAEVIKLLLDRGADANIAAKVTITHPKRGGISIVNKATPYPKDLPVGGMTALVLAARQNATAAVDALLDGGVSVDQTIGSGGTALLIAIQNGHTALATDLIERGADVNKVNSRGWSPLYMAVKVRSMELGTMPNPPTEGVFELIKLLVDKGADINHRLDYDTEVHDAIASTWLREAGGTALLRAAWCGDLEVMKLLLEHGADPNIATNDGTNALMALAGVGYAEGFIKDVGGREQSLEAMKILIDAGIDVNAKNRDEVQALHGAAHKNFVEGIQLLVDSGADINGISRWRGIEATPLDWAMGVRIGGSSTIYHDEGVALIKKLAETKGVEAKAIYPNNERGG
jgi:ankyrin repeat protein